MSTPFAYKLVPAQGFESCETLVIGFNCLNNFGLDDRFGMYRTLTQAFPDSDVLLLKDAIHFNWYISIMQELQRFLIDLVHEKGYQKVFAISSSAGSIPLLNIMPHVPNFRKAVVINGQVSIHDDVQLQTPGVARFGSHHLLRDDQKIMISPLDRDIPDDKGFQIKLVFNVCTEGGQYHHAVDRCQRFPNQSVFVEAHDEPDMEHHIFPGHYLTSRMHDIRSFFQM